MADNTTLNSGSGGDPLVTREISHAGDTAKLAGSFLMGITGTEGAYTAAAINGDATYGLDVDIVRCASHEVTNAGTFACQVTAISAGDNNIGNVDIVTVPADPFGVNADAAAADGSISAKLRFIASTGIPITGTVTVGSHAVTNAGTFAVQAAQSGTWTVDLGATDNAVLDAIAASLAGTLTVGTHAVTQSGTWTVTGAGGSFPVTDSGGSLTVDSPVGTPVFVRLSDGSAAITTLAVSLASVPSHAVTNAGTFVVQVDAISAGSNLIGDVGLQPRTSGGLTMSKTTSAASTNATSLKASAGQVYSIQCFSVNAAVRYLKLYNKASAPTVGTDTPVKTLAIPGNTAGAGFVISWPQGLAFATGIAFALTTEATDAGTTGVAANEITVNIDYK